MTRGVTWASDQIETFVGRKIGPLLAVVVLAFAACGCGGCWSVEEVRLSSNVQVQIRRPPVDWPHILDRKSTVVTLWLDSDGRRTRIAAPAPALSVGSAADGGVLMVHGPGRGAVVVMDGHLTELRQLGTGCDYGGTLFDGPPAAACGGCLRRSTDGWSVCERAEHTLYDPVSGAFETHVVDLPPEAELCTGLDEAYGLSADNRPVILVDCSALRREDGTRIRSTGSCFAAEVLDGGMRELWRSKGPCDSSRARSHRYPLAPWEQELVEKAPELGVRVRVLPRTFSY